MRTAAFLILFLAGCNASFLSDAACIDADDVLEIPPGNAQGTDLSGEYEIVSGFSKSCGLCARNTAPDPCVDFFTIVEEGFVDTITQEGGVLTFDAAGDQLLGSVADDGSFTVGTIDSAIDAQGEIVGQVLVLFEGLFVSDRILVDAVFHVTTNEGVAISDYVFVNEVVYERAD